MKKAIKGANKMIQEAASDSDEEFKTVSGENELIYNQARGG